MYNVVLDSFISEDFLAIHGTIIMSHLDTFFGNFYYTFYYTYVTARNLFYICFEIFLFIYNKPKKKSNETFLIVDDHHSVQATWEMYLAHLQTEMPNRNVTGELAYDCLCKER